MFPPEYRNRIFIAQHGSWNRAKKSGYRVMMVTLKDNKVERYEVFAEGWLRDEQRLGPAGRRAGDAGRGAADFGRSGGGGLSSQLSRSLKAINHGEHGELQDRVLNQGFSALQPCLSERESLSKPGPASGAFAASVSVSSVT